MAKYRINYWINGKPRKRHEGPIRDTVAAAMADCPPKDRLKVATVLRDSEGADHPDNAGKFFLHQILK